MIQLPLFQYNVSYGTFVDALARDWCMVWNHIKKITETETDSQMT